MFVPDTAVRYLQDLAHLVFSVLLFSRILVLQDYLFIYLFHIFLFITIPSSTGVSYRGVNSWYIRTWKSFRAHDVW